MQIDQLDEIESFGDLLDALQQTYAVSSPSDIVMGGKINPFRLYVRAMAEGYGRLAGRLYSLYEMDEIHTGTALLEGWSVAGDLDFLRELQYAGINLRERFLDVLQVVGTKRRDELHGLQQDLEDIGVQVADLRIPRHAGD